MKTEFQSSSRNDYGLLNPKIIMIIGVLAVGGFSIPFVANHLFNAGQGQEAGEVVQTLPTVRP